MDLEALGPHVLLEIAMYDNEVHCWLLRNSRVYALFSTGPLVQALFQKSLIKRVKEINERDNKVEYSTMMEIN